MGIAVAAETEEIADEALKLVKIDWDVRPFVLDPIEAMKKDAPLVHPDLYEDQRAAARSQERPGHLRGPRQRRRGIQAGRLRRRGGLHLPQRPPGGHGQLVLPRGVEGAPAHGLVQLLRRRPDPDAHQRDAGPAAPPGPGDLLVRRRPVRQERHRRPAVLPRHEPARDEDGPAREVPAQPAPVLHQHPAARDLPFQGRREEGRDHHLHPPEVDRERRSLRRPLDVRAEVRAEGAGGGGAGAHPEHPARIVRRVHERHTGVHDARGGQLPVQPDPRAPDRRGGRAAGDGPRRLLHQELRARVGAAAEQEPRGGPPRGRAADRLEGKTASPPARGRRSTASSGAASGSPSTRPGTRSGRRSAAARSRSP